MYQIFYNVDKVCTLDVLNFGKECTKYFDNVDKECTWDV